MNKTTKTTLALGGMLSFALLTGCTLNTNKTATTQPTQTSEKPRIPDFPALQGKPEVGKWYGVYPKDAKTALGEPYHGIFKLGSSRNVMVLFNGGGVSVDAHTATERTFTTDPRGDVMQMFGLGGGGKESPFADWTVINLPYSTGDFHAGAGDFAFKNEKTGAAEVLHHYGATNFDLVMNEVRQYVGTPDNLLVAGYSAGGFATALMSERVMGYFPETKNVTVAVDSALLLSDKWQDIAKNVWHSPKDITERLKTNNLTLDSLTALAKAHPDVKVLFSSSPRDEDLVNVQNYLSMGRMVKTAEGGVQYQKDLTEFVASLRKNVPNTAFYIFAGGKSDSMGLTTHTMLMLTPFAPLNTITPAEWIHRAVNGKLENYGLDLLEK